MQKVLQQFEVVGFRPEIADMSPLLPGPANGHVHLRPGIAVKAVAFEHGCLDPELGKHGLKRSTQVAILNANYIASRLDPHCPVVYKGSNGRVAHECVVNLAPIKDSCGVTVEDVAKRLVDYGFHAPTMSWPVPDSLMIEPTESESKNEIDPFQLAIRDYLEALSY